MGIDILGNLAFPGTCNLGYPIYANWNFLPELITSIIAATFQARLNLALGKFYGASSMNIPFDIGLTAIIENQSGTVEFY